MAVTTASAYPVSKHQLSYLLVRAPLVVVAQIDRVGAGTKVERQHFTFTEVGSPLSFLLRPVNARVMAVIQGDDLKPGGALDFSYLAQALGERAQFLLRDYAAGERWLLFLYRYQDHWEPLDPVGWSDLRLPSDYTPGFLNYDLPLERAEALFTNLLLRYPTHPVTQEVLEALTGGTTYLAVPWQVAPHEQGVPIPWSSSASQVGIPARHQVGFTSVGLVWGLMSLRYTAGDDVTKAQAMAILCRANYVDAFAPLVDVTRSMREKGEERAGIGVDAISYLADPRAIPMLRQLLTDPDAIFHRPAAEALRAIADPSTIPSLAAALDDLSPDVRFYAADGLATITGDEAHGPVYQADNREVVAYWKEWCRTHAAAPKG